MVWSPSEWAVPPTAQAFRLWIFSAHQPLLRNKQMDHQLRIALQADQDTWVCEVGGWNGADLNATQISRMRDLLDAALPSSTRALCARNGSS